MEIKDVLKNINSILPSLADGLQINNCDINILTLYGSFDFSYYHNLEIIFSEPSYISVPIVLHTEDLKVRMGNEDEQNIIKNQCDTIDNDDKLFVFENNVNKYYLFAKDIKINKGLVYYYKRNELKPGERIADWL